MQRLIVSLALLLSVSSFCETKPQQITFSSVKPACSIVDNKLILAKAWPFGSWEDCAYSILSTAVQLDAKATQLAKQLEDQKPKK